MSVNYRIKEVLKEAGLTMVKMAEIRGVSPISVSRKVNHSKFTLEQLIDIAQMTGCKVECAFVFPNGKRIQLYEHGKEGDESMGVNYQELLAEKVQKEYDNFLEGLKEMPVKKVIESSYEKVFKEDLVICIENEHLEPTEAKALYKQKYPLDYCYQKWRDTDCSYMDMLRDVVSDAAKDAVKEMKSKNRESR